MLSIKWRQKERRFRTAEVRGLLLKLRERQRVPNCPLRNVGVGAVHPSVSSVRAAQSELPIQRGVCHTKCWVLPTVHWDADRQLPGGHPQLQRVVDSELNVALPVPDDLAACERAVWSHGWRFADIVSVIVRHDEDRVKGG